MNRHEITKQRRAELLLEKVTLNDQPALISGIKNDFATVRQIDSGLGCEWAWATVDHIVRNRDGKFKS